MDIVDNINRYLAGDKTAPKAVKSRLTKARDEIVLLRAELEALQNQAPVGWLYNFVTCNDDLVKNAFSMDYSETADCHNIRPLYLAAGAKEKTE